MQACREELRGAELAKLISEARMQIIVLERACAALQDDAPANSSELAEIDAMRMEVAANERAVLDETEMLNLLARIYDGRAAEHVRLAQDNARLRALVESEECGDVQLAQHKARTGIIP
jgi:hypothetical protein